MNVPEFLLKIAGEGVEVSLRPFICHYEDKRDYGVVWAVGGFYKHGHIYLVPMTGRTGFMAFGRYEALREVDDYDSLVSLNFREFECFEQKGYTINKEWGPILERAGYIRKEISESWVRA